MTDTNLINEIEEFLAVTANRDLFTAQEIQDFLLDLRNLADTGGTTEKPRTGTTGAESVEIASTIPN